jgi:hypothetical protein
MYCSTLFVLEVIIHLLILILYLFDSFSILQIVQSTLMPKELTLEEACCYRKTGKSKPGSSSLAGKHPRQRKRNKGRDLIGGAVVPGHRRWLCSVGWLLIWRRISRALEVEPWGIHGGLGVTGIRKDSIFGILRPSPAPPSSGSGARPPPASCASLTDAGAPPRCGDDAGAWCSSGCSPRSPAVRRTAFGLGYKLLW